MEARDDALRELPLERERIAFAVLQRRALRREISLPGPPADPLAAREREADLLALAP